MSDTPGFVTKVLIRFIDHVFDDQLSKFLNPTPEYKAIKRTVAKLPQLKRHLQGALDRLFIDPSATRAFGYLFDGYADEGHMVLLEDKLCKFLSGTSITNAEARECIIYYAHCLRREYGRDNVLGLLQHHATRKAIPAPALTMDDTTAIRQIGAESPRLLLGRPQDPPEPSADESVWDRRIDQANKLRKLGETTRAQRRFHAILNDFLERSVDSSRILYRLHTSLAICSIASGALDDAERWAREALQGQPPDDLAEALLARIALARGRTDTAKRKASTILERNPLQPQAWVVTILSSSEPLVRTSLPPELDDDTDVLLALSEHYAHHGDLTQALTIARDASHHAGTSPHACVSVAESLLYLGTLPIDAEPLSEDNSLVGDLVNTAISLLGDVERSSLLSRAYCARSGLRLIVGDLDGAERDGRRGYRADPKRIEAAFAWARALAAVDNIAGALFVLDQCESCDDDPPTLALRARLLADIGGREPELERSVRSAIDRLTDADGKWHVLLDLADLASATRMTELAKEALARLGGNVPEYMAALILARIDRANERPRQALRHYSQALSRAPARRYISLAYEYASAAHKLDAYADAVTILDEVGVDDAPDSVRRIYVHSLIKLKRWGRVSDFIDGMASRSKPLEEWALDVASVVALRRNDLDGAVAHLTRLLSLGTEGKASVEARLAQTLFRMGRSDEAVAFAENACARREATAILRLEMAKLFFQARHYDVAIRTAFVALRELPATAEGDAVYVHIFATSPDDISTKSDVSTVDVNTWVKLRGDDGSEASYWLLGDDVVIGGHNELSSTSPKADLLLGLTLGESVSLQPNSVDPMRFTVVKTLTVWAQAFREAIQRASTRLSVEDNPIQSIRIGDPPTVKFMSTITGMLHRNREAQYKIEQLYGEGRVPLAVLGHLPKRTCREAYYRAMRLDCGILVESGAADSLRDAMKTVTAAQRAVIHTSALVTLQELRMLHVLPAVIVRPLIPASVTIELRSEQTRITHDLERGHTAWMGLEGDNVVFSQGSPEEAKRMLDALDELLSWIESFAVEMPRPSEALTGRNDELRSLIGEPTCDSYMLSGADVPLYADDWVLRQFARAERSASSFTTYTLLCLAMEQEVISSNKFCRGVDRLIELRHQFVPVSADLLLYAIRSDSYLVGDATRRCLHQLVSGSVNSSAPIFAAFVRALAVSNLGRGIVGAVAQHCRSLLKDVYPREPQVVWTYRAWARNALRLDPLLLEDVERAFTSDS